MKTGNDIKILVVDDDEDIREALQDALEDENYLVDLAQTGQQALELAANNEYDIAFIDYQLPDTTGLEVCKQITSPNTVKVFMTGAFDDNVTTREVAFLEAGGEIHYLYKPFMRGEVLAVADKIISKKNKS
jgi:two-component system response regulator ResD